MELVELDSATLKRVMRARLADVRAELLWQLLGLDEDALAWAGYSEETCLKLQQERSALLDRLALTPVESLSVSSRIVCSKLCRAAL